MKVYGLDLGTTYSCVAYIDDSGRPIIAKNGLSEDTTPSVVYFESSEPVVVGRAAKSTAVLYRDLVVSLVKREMGQEVSWECHGKKETPETISALILKEVAASASQRTGEEVRDVVIPVPAYFG